MNRLKIGYWIVTGIVALMMGFGSIFNIMSNQESIDLIHLRLGYPPYIIPFLGVAKLLGSIVILIPGLKRLKEWAYAGLVYDLTGAAYSSICIGASPGEWGPLFGMIMFLFISYTLHHRLQSVPAGV